MNAVNRRTTKPASPSRLSSWMAWRKAEYVVNNLALDVPMSEPYKGVLPFLAWDVLRVILLLFFPVLSLGLVTLLFR